MTRVVTRSPAAQAGFLHVDSLWGFILVGIVVLAVAVTGVLAGYQLGRSENGAARERVARELKGLFQAQRRELAEAQRAARQRLDALALRLGQMQAHMIRLDALGERLTEIGKLDRGEFDFKEEPPLGGPEEGGKGEVVKAPELVADLQRLSRQIADRERKLDLLEDLIMNRNLERELSPAGQPIKKGWISSFFGMRKDPFTGRRKMHKGMDFAAKKGADVVAVASGIVTFAGPRSGYGNLVEIRHGRGYSTRYGHNERILVHVGDRVRAGQVIAKIGSTGHSTGPHVHFEVLRNGTQINPRRFVARSRPSTILK